MNAFKSIAGHAPTIKVSAPAHTPSQTIPQTPFPVVNNPFDNMSSAHNWEALMDERINLAKQCQFSDGTETLEKLLLTPTIDALVQNGNDGDSCNSRSEVRELHKDTVLVGRKAYDTFHDIIEEFKREKPKEDAWEEKIGAAALMAKDAMVAALDKFALDSKAIIRLVEGEQLRMEDAKFFNYCVNGYVLFSRKVNEALELVYESRQGGQPRIWTALETAGRIVREAEVAALEWVDGKNAFASPTVCFQT